MARGLRDLGDDGQVLLTVKETAASLRVSAFTVYGMVERGEMPHVRLGSAIRIVVEAFPKSGRGLRNLRYIELADPDQSSIFV